MTEGTVKRGFVVDSRDVEGHREEGDTATEQVTIAAGRGAAGLEQRILRFAAGESRARGGGGREEILYAVSGRGTLLVGAEAERLEPETGAYVAPGERWSVENGGPADLVVVSVLVPEPGEGPRDAEAPRTVRWADQPAHRAGKNREFRHIVDTRAVTQFVGSIPPGRARDHYHLYEEVAYVLEGEGILHMEDEHTRIGAGSCILFPPPVPHCVENTGTSWIRVLGVFTPPGSPAEAYNVPE